MKTRKVIALLLAIVTFGSLLAACKKPETGETIPRNEYGPPDSAPGTELSQEWKDKIAQHYKLEVSWYDETTKTGMRYCGTFNGYCVVFSSKTHSTKVYSETIAGYKFKMDGKLNIYVYIFKQFVSETIYLSSAYYKGLITKEQVEEIYNYHKSLYPEYYE